MGIHLKDTKLIMVSGLVIFVVIFSAFGYSWIVHEESRTGGMGEKWEMATSPTNGPLMDMITPDGSILFIDSGSHMLSMVDNDGRVVWSHEYDVDSGCPQLIGNDIYYVDVTENGHYKFECIGLDGTVKISTPCPPIQNFNPGVDGRIYASASENNASISSIYSIEGGIVVWNLTENGSLYVIKVWQDGDVLLRHSVFHQEITNTSQVNVIDMDELLMLTANGSLKWSMPLPSGDWLASVDTFASINGTILTRHQIRGWLETTGYSTSGEKLWFTNSTIDQSSSETFFGCQALGNNVESVYYVDRSNDSNSWIVRLNDTWGGSMYVLDGMEIFVSANGHAYGFDRYGSILWHIDTEVTGTTQCAIDEKIGVLVMRDNSITKICRDGTFWTYDGIDSSIYGGRLVSNDTVYVLTSTKIIAIYKPTVSMPSEYLIAMISADLLTALSCGLYIADRMIKKSN